MWGVGIAKLLEHALLGGDVILGRGGAGCVYEGYIYFE
jgi:hypothetical protein